MIRSAEDYITEVSVPMTDNASGGAAEARVAPRAENRATGETIQFKSI